MPDRLVLELAHLVDDEQLETRLRSALARDVRLLALDTGERVTIFAALDEPPPGLEQLRAVLLQEHTRRLAGGI